MFQLWQYCSAWKVRNPLFQVRKVSPGLHRDWDGRLPPTCQCQERLFSVAKDDSQETRRRAQKASLKRAIIQKQYNPIPCTLVLVRYAQIRMDSVLQVSCFLLPSTLLLLRPISPTFFFFSVSFGMNWGGGIGLCFLPPHKLLCMGKGKHFFFLDWKTMRSLR